MIKIFKDTLITTNNGNKNVESISHIDLNTPTSLRVGVFNSELNHVEFNDQIQRCVRVPSAEDNSSNFIRITDSNGDSLICDPHTQVMHADRSFTSAHTCARGVNLLKLMYRPSTNEYEITSSTVSHVDLIPRRVEKTKFDPDDTTTDQRFIENDSYDLVLEPGTYGVVANSFVVR